MNKPKAPIPSFQWDKTRTQSSKNVCSMCWCEAPVWSVKQTTHYTHKHLLNYTVSGKKTNPLDLA